MKASNEAYSRISQGEIDKVLFYVTKHGEVAGVTAISVASGTNISYQRASMIIEDLVKEDKIHPHDRKGDKRIYYMPGPGEKPVQKVEEKAAVPIPERETKPAPEPTEKPKDAPKTEELYCRMPGCDAGPFTDKRRRRGHECFCEKNPERLVPPGQRKKVVAAVIQKEPASELMPPCPVCGKPRDEWKPEEGPWRREGVDYCSFVCMDARTPKCSTCADDQCGDMGKDLVACDDHELEESVNTIALPLSNPVQELHVTRTDEPAPQVTSTLSKDVQLQVAEPEPAPEHPKAPVDIVILARDLGKQISDEAAKQGYSVKFHLVEDQEPGKSSGILVVQFFTGIEEKQPPCSNPFMQIFGR